MIVIASVKCGSNKSINREKKLWVDTYKKTAYYECLKESYNNDTIFNLIQNQDVLFINENIDFKTLDKIRILGHEASMNAKAPIYKYDDYKEGQKDFMSNCLDFYNSDELEKKAIEAYKKRFEKL